MAGHGRDFAGMNFQRPGIAKQNNRAQILVKALCDRAGVPGGAAGCFTRGE
jgi:hypothetical protein